MKEGFGFVIFAFSNPSLRMFYYFSLKGIKIKPIGPALNSGFCSMKRPGILLLPPPPSPLPLR